VIALIFDMLKFVGRVCFAIGLIGGLWAWSVTTFIAGISVFISFVLTGFIFLGLGAIAQSLHNIEMKIVGKPEESEVLKRFRGDYDEETAVNKN
jgi:putative Mn2+ efflux pump MntP